MTPTRVSGRGLERQITKQIGEYMVAANVARNCGLLVTPFAGNVPHFDLLAADATGHTTFVQVKTIRRGGFQPFARNFLTIELVDGIQTFESLLPAPVKPLYFVFVQLAKDSRDDRFWVLNWDELTTLMHEVYFRGETSIKRKETSASFHTVIWPSGSRCPKEWPLYQDAWEKLIRERAYV